MLKKKGFTLIELMIVVSIIATLAAIQTPNLTRARAQAHFTQCQSNLRNIGIALEMYGTDNVGRYPNQITRISPEYMNTVPICGAAGKDTYQYEYKSNPDAYTITCKGNYHNTVIPDQDYPQYNSSQGLVSRR